MHKLAKGLKKKKKGKKSKHKEEEFKPEELEAYRRERAAAGEAAATKNEEWRNFLSLTSGVDDILKKTQDDLYRIKSTSFFQRIPPPSETKAKQEQEVKQNQIYAEANATAAKTVKQPEVQLGIVQVSESESEEEEDDDIFDTAYIDAIATGEVKLAYIPESPTDKQDGDDPFDTSIAERAILGPAVERKGKKLVPLGAAVEVLTGRVQLPTCATKSVSRRQILKERDLLLGSFDNETELRLLAQEQTTSPEKVKTLLDDDEIPLPDEPIDLSKTLYIPPPVPQEGKSQSSSQKIELKEFEEDEDDKEFEALAAESLTKTPVPTSKVVFTDVPVAVIENCADWKPFDKNDAGDGEATNEEVDPFDTTFAENILPGKAELKLIEKEVLENDLDFNPRADIHPSVQKIQQAIKDRVAESQLHLITPEHRDLLGGSTTDLSKLEEKPILPNEQIDHHEIKYCDPFDTSIVDAVKVPGQAELKYLEKELLGDIACDVPKKVSKTVSIDEDDFNPRASEPQRTKQRTLSRPDVLNVNQSKSVTFSVPQNDLLDIGDSSKAAKPLTPFYVRKNSVPGAGSPETPVIDQDPFDTSFVPALAPGKVELKILEKEFITSKDLQQPVEDKDFDPRDEHKVAKLAAVEAIKEIAIPKPKPATFPVETEPIDLLSASHNISAKVLTPAAERKTNPLGEETLSYADPFDTSIATNILPGKAELKLLENELIDSKQDNLSIQQNKDLLVHSGDTIIEKPLSPELSIDVEEQDIDPFDTSFACNIQPGRAELKVLESELI